VRASNASRTYLQHLLQDEARLRAFIDRLAINVSELFRNPEQFQILGAGGSAVAAAAQFQLRLWSAAVPTSGGIQLGDSAA
jgi:chemotaxis methyl-accepting protein methylase